MTTIDTDNQSSTENLHEINRIKKLNEQELQKFSLENALYEISGETITRNLDTAKNYLSKTTFKEWNSVTGIMAVQMLLEAQNYEVGKIDGIKRKKTIDALKKFQEDNNLTPNGIINKKTVQTLLGVEDNGGGDTGETINNDVPTRSSREERQKELQNITEDNIEKIIDGYVEYERCIGQDILNISDPKVLEKAISYMTKERLHKGFYLKDEEHTNSTITNNLILFAKKGLVSYLRMDPCGSFNESHLDVIQNIRFFDPSIQGEIGNKDDGGISISSFKHIHMLFDPNIIDISKNTYTEQSLTIEEISSNLNIYKKITTGNDHIFYTYEDDNNGYLKFNNYDLKCNKEDMYTIVTTLDERVSKATEEPRFKDYNFGIISGNLEMSKTGRPIQDSVVFKNAEGRLKTRGVDPDQFLTFINEYIAEIKKQN